MLHFLIYSSLNFGYDAKERKIFTIKTLMEK